MRAPLLAIAIAYSVSLAPAQSPILHVKLSPSNNIIVGQPVHLVVEVLVPNFFTGAPAFPTFEIENAIVVLPEETPQNFNQLVNGQTLSGIRRTYAIYPQMAGHFQLPPAKIDVPYANAPPKTTEAHLALPPLRFHAEIPASARGLSYFLPTARLTMQQHWSAPINKLRAGDVIERTITVSVDKMQAMLIPPLPFEAPAGIKVYPEEAKVQNQKTDRGEFIQGLRVQSAKYFIPKDGEYSLPAIEVAWWNLNTKRLVTTTIPSVHFVAAPNPNAATELTPEAEPTPTVESKPISLKSRYPVAFRNLPLAFAALFLLYLAYRYGPECRKYLIARYAQYTRSEWNSFRTLMRSCRRNDAISTYRNLLIWLGKVEPKGTLDNFLRESDDEELTSQITALTEALFVLNAQRPWNGRSMARRLRKHRSTRVLRTRKRGMRLPALNPQ